MPTKPRPASAEAWGSVLRLHAALVPRIDQRVQAGTGLSLSWYDVLLELEAAPGRRLRMSDLGDRVVLSRTRVSRIVDEMVQSGLVTRETNDDDRRSAFAVITAKGRGAFHRGAPVYLNAIEHEFARELSVRELTAVRDSLDKVLASLSPKPAALPAP